MLTLTQRVNLLEQLGQYLQSSEENWIQAKERAARANGWHTEEFINLATKNISNLLLTDSNTLRQWTAQYHVPEEQPHPKNVGIVMAGNIPLVGFHDFLCVFASGHISCIKLSTRDEVLLKHIIDMLISWEPAVANYIKISDMLKNCDAYIATGSNNTAGYFDYYFQKYPNIIRRNRTSLAILTGKETEDELALLANDIYLYFGLGCRNVTKILVPQHYNFVPLLKALDRYNYLADNQKYKNNYDYNLAILLLNKQYYMSNASILLVEDDKLFSPIAQLNYSFYTDIAVVEKELEDNNQIQCIVGSNHIPFGKAQYPSLNDYADGVDTMLFIKSIS